MNLPPLRIETRQHPREARAYQVEFYTAFQFGEFLNQQQPHAATRYVVNIGAQDGVSYDDPALPFFRAGYVGLAIEAEDNPELARNLPSPDIRKLTRTTLTPLNVADVLGAHHVPKSLDYLKLDIDGYDGPLLAAILQAGYLPRLLQVEVNPEIPPPFEFSVMYHPDYRCQDARGYYTGFYGMSTAYAARIVREFGYHILSFDNLSMGSHDLIMARNDLADEFGSDTAMDSAAIRRRYLDQPLPVHLHFTEQDIDPFPWRHRTDYPDLSVDVWKACAAAGAAKHDVARFPFHFSIAL